MPADGSAGDWFAKASREMKGEAKQGRRESFEARVARLACRAHGVDPKFLESEARRILGDRELRLDHLRTLLDEPLPVDYRVGRLTRLHELTFPDLFKRFESTPIWRAYALLAADRDDDRPLAMVFSWANVSPTCCMHDAAVALDNDPVDLPEPEPTEEADDPPWRCAVRIVVMANDPALGRRRFVIEPFETFLLGVS